VGIAAKADRNDETSPDELRSEQVQVSVAVGAAAYADAGRSIKNPETNHSIPHSLTVRSWPQLAIHLASSLTSVLKTLPE
jgi:hypothetical protein